MSKGSTARRLPFVGAAVQFVDANSKIVEAAIVTRVLDPPEQKVVNLRVFGHDGIDRSVSVIAFEATARAMNASKIGFPVRLCWRWPVG